MRNSLCHAAVISTLENSNSFMYSSTSKTAGPLPQGTLSLGGSLRRNPLICEMFRRIHMGEAWRRGMPLIRKNAPSVTFREVTGEKSPLAASEKMSEKMSEKILAILTEKPKASIADMARTTGVTTRTIERNLQKLIASNRLRRIGPDKGGRWEVLPAPDATRRGAGHGG